MLERSNLKKWLITASLFGLLFGLQKGVSASPNTRYEWGLVKSKNEQQADAGAQYNTLIGKHGAVYKGDPSKKIIYLTFDNGYENGYTDQVLDVLKKHKVPAIFFVTGHYLKTAPEISKRMVKEGHLIGNHSWHHPDFTQVSDQKMKEELDTVKAETQKLTGQKTMNYMRPPRGVFSERTMQIANDLGYKHIFWSLAYKDWEVNNQKGSAYAYQSIMSQIHPGAIVLLHTVSKDNAEALDKVITDVKKKGYQFKSIDYLFVK